MIPPIFMNSLHIKGSIEKLYSNKRFEEDNFIYGRESNPTVYLAEKKIAALEQETMALCFGSGMVATSAAILSAWKGRKIGLKISTRRFMPSKPET